MADRADNEGHPVLVGLLALVGVGLAVGLILGGAALAGTQVLGIGGSTTTDSASSGQSMYLPKPEKTEGAGEPAITLAPGETAPAPTLPTEIATPEPGIVLAAGQAAVSSMQQIDLTGTYTGPQSEGAILQVQRFQGDDWADFPVTVSVSGGTFSTYVQTGQPGQARFRVTDTNTGLSSNEVSVTIS